jgi:hypothetical protein
LTDFFPTCNRANIRLSDDLKKEEGTESAREKQLRTLSFYESKLGGRIRAMDSLGSKRPPREKDFTVGYLVSIPRVPGIGCRLVNLFGMGGTETLWLCYMLRRFRSEIVGQALEFKKPRLWLIPFLVPHFVPQPLLCCESDTLIPKAELSEPICFTLGS